MRILTKVFLITAIIFNSQICFAQTDLSNITELKEQVIVLYNANKLKEAYQLISKIPEDKRDSEVWLIAANITQDYDRTLDTIFLLQKAISVDGENYKPYYNLGNIYFKDKKFNSAISNYETALKYNKEFPYAWYNIGCCYLELQDYTKAKSAFQRAITFKNDDPDFYYNLAYTFKKLNKKKQSEKFLKIYNTMLEQRI